MAYNIKVTLHLQVILSLTIGVEQPPGCPRADKQVTHPDTRESFTTSAVIASARDWVEIVKL